MASTGYLSLCCFQQTNKQTIINLIYSCLREINEETANRKKKKQWILISVFIWKLNKYISGQDRHLKLPLNKWIKYQQPKTTFSIVKSLYLQRKCWRETSRHQKPLCTAHLYWFWRVWYAWGLQDCILRKWKGATTPFVLPGSFHQMVAFPNVSSVTEKEGK